MCRCGEHVAGADAGEFIGGLVAFGGGGEDPEVAGEGRAVAADVDDAVGSEGADGVKEAFLAALAGRVEDDDVGMDERCVLIKVSPGGNILSRRGKEAGICQMIAPGVGRRVTDGLRDDLDAVDFPGLFREEMGNGADAAEEVEDGLRPGQTGKFDGCLVEAKGLGRIHLIEGQGRNSEFEAAETIRDPGIAEERKNLPAEDDICLFRVDIQANAADRGDGRFLRSLLSGRSFPVRGLQKGPVKCLLPI